MKLPVLEFQAIRPDPMLSPELLQAAISIFGDRAEIQDIIPRGIFQLGAGQRPLRPVGSGLSLGMATSSKVFTSSA